MSFVIRGIRDRFRKPAILEASDSFSVEDGVGRDITGDMSIQARYLTPEEVAEYGATVPDAWKQGFPSTVQRILGMGKKPEGSGAGYVMSPYLQMYSLVYGLMPIADLPKYRILLRNEPDIKQAIDMQAILAVGRPFRIEYKHEDSRVFLERLCDRVDLNHQLIAFMTDGLVYGTAYAEIQWNDAYEEEQQTEFSKQATDPILNVKAEDLDPRKIDNGYIFTVKSLQEKMEKARSNGDLFEVQGKQYIKTKILKKRKYKKKELNSEVDILGVKPLDPIYIRPRVDAFGNFHGHLQWLDFPPVLLDNDVMLHYRHNFKSWAYESHPPTTLVRTNPSVKAISELFIGDKVLTASGEYREIEELPISHYYQGKMYKIYGKYTNIPLECTWQHPILTYRKGEFNFVYAKDLVKGDNLVIPTNTEFEDIKSLDLRDFMRYETLSKAGFTKERNELLWKKYEDTKNYSKISRFLCESGYPTTIAAVSLIIKGLSHSKGLSVNIPFNKELFRLVGYYLSEGSMSRKGRNFARIDMAFGLEEKEYAEEVLRLAYNTFGVTSKIKRVKNTWMVSIYSTVLAIFLDKSFGRGSHTKHISEIFMKAKPELQKELFEAWMNGDGFTNKDGSRLGTTVSKELAYQLHYLWLRQSKSCAINIRHYEKKSKLKDGRTINSSDQYTIAPKKGKCSKLIGTRFIIPITKIETYDYNGDVWDIHVPGDETFCTEFGYAVHNSQFGCIPKGTKVFTNFGMTPIEEVKEGSNIYSFKDGKLCKSKVEKLVSYGIQDIYEVKTTHRSIKATNNHPFLTLEYNVRDLKNRKGYKGFSRLVWKEIKDLKIGNKIIILKNVPDEGKPHVFVIPNLSDNYTIKRRWKEKQVGITLPKETTEDLCKLWGFLIGDGWIHNNQLSIALSKDKANNDKYVGLINKIFSVKGFTRKDGTQYTINSKLVVSFFRENSWIDRAYNKRIPLWIYTLPKCQRKAFVEGFIEADGWEVKAGFQFEIVNQKLTEDFKLLIDSIGWKSGQIYKRKREPGSIGKRKFINVNETYGLFFSKKDLFALGGRGVANTKRLSDLVDTNYFGAEEIYGISYAGKDEVWDVCVPETNAFIANNIVLHNTSILMPLIRNNDLLRRFQDDMAIAMHYQAVMPLVVKGGSKEHPYDIDRMKDLMGRLRNRSAATTLFVKGDVEVLPLQGNAAELRVDWWLEHLLKMRRSALGVPPHLLGIPQDVSKSAADVMLAEFISRLEVYREQVSDMVINQMFVPLIKARWGEDIIKKYGEPKVVWEPIIQEDRNTRLARVMKMTEAGIYTVNEARKECGLDSLGKEYDKPTPKSTSPFGKSVGIKRPSAALSAGEKDMKKIDNIYGEALSSELLDVLRGVRIDLGAGDTLIKDVKGKALGRARETISNWIEKTGKADFDSAGMLNNFMTVVDDYIKDSNG